MAIISSSRYLTTTALCALMAIVPVNARLDAKGYLPVLDALSDAVVVTALSADSATVAAVIEGFHAALAVGDSVKALSLLASDAVILESGGMENREEYRSHHLPADIAFAQAVQSDRGPIRVTVRGDVAWATSTGTTRGEYRGRSVNSAGAELMVLARTSEGWKIAAIHWSSRAIRT
jgi:ketosteroid isomerase-like protein